MKSFQSFALFVLALCAAAPAVAQQNGYIVRDGAGTILNKCAVHMPDGSLADCSAEVKAPAASTPLTGTVTSTGVSATSGLATFSSGTALIGPLTPDLGRDIGLKLWSTNSASFSCQMVDSIDNGVTKLPLTIFDTQIGGPYTVPINSVITSESLANSKVYLNCAVTAGTLNYVVAQ